mgnify:CR=1 FL=1
MSRPIPLDAVEALFRQCVAEAAPPGTPLTMGRALDLTCRFYLDTPIAGVDATEEPEADMLLFQWGHYEEPQGPARRFCLDLTRQFQLAGDEEFWQLSLSLYFPPGPEALGDGSCWSADYEQLADWQRAVEQLVPAERWDAPAAQVEMRLSAT